VQREIHQRIEPGEERVLLQRHQPHARLDGALALVGIDLPGDQRSSVVLPAPLRPISASRSRGRCGGQDRGKASRCPGEAQALQLKIGAAAMARA
jgi:hypothetical protein